MDACKEILHRHVKPSSDRILSPLLLVRSTGGGKSAVRDVSGFLCGSITLTIVPLLSLAADQTAKLEQLSLDMHLFHRFHVFNLDIIRSSTLNQQLRSNLESLTGDDDDSKTISLFTSPQKITTDPEWQKTIATCCSNGTLRLIAVDECHLYAAHGMEFREEFAHLRECFFRIAEKSSKHSIPVLFMTATASQSMVMDLQQLTGLAFHPNDDLLWPQYHSGVERRNISLQLSFQDSPIRRIKAELVKTCKSAGGRKIIIYSNSRKAIINLHAKSRMHLNVLGIQKDVVLVHGNMFREQKFHHTDMFVAQPLMDECPTTRMLLRFDPVAYFATAGTSSSGLDCSEVDKVIFHGFPSSIEDLLQCSGRCGRNAQAHPGNSSFCLILSLNSLVAIMTRIFLVPKYEEARLAQSTTEQSPTTTTNKQPNQPPSNSATLGSTELAARQWMHVRQVASLLCLDNGRCIHHQLEELMLHPHASRVCDMDSSCGNACWRCSKDAVSTPLDAAIDKDRFKAYLVEIFIRGKLAPSQFSLHRDCFLNALLNFETIGPDDKPIAIFHKAVFGVKTQQTARPRTKALLVKCFAAGILEPDVEGFHLRAKLGYSPNGNPLLNNDNAWAGFKLTTFDI